MGPARTKRLLAQYGGIKRLKQASKEELMGLGWLPPDIGGAVFDMLHGSSGPSGK
jgi:excinuclease ABC subunit C